MNQPSKALFGGKREFCTKDPRSKDLFAICVENRSEDLLKQYDRVVLVMRISQSDTPGQEDGKFQSELRVTGLLAVTELNAIDHPIEFSDECGQWCKEGWLAVKLGELIDEWSISQRANDPMQELMAILSGLRQGAV